MTTRSPHGDDGRERFLTTANLLSISRILLAVPFVLIMESDLPHARLWAAGVMALAAATDKFDGIVARGWEQSTRWGHILDPLADKLAVGSAVTLLLVRGEIPLWFVVLALGRDVAILLTGLWLRAARGILLPPNRTGKWAVGILALALVLLVLGLRGPVTDTVLAASALLLAASLLLYARRFLQVLRGALPPGAVHSGGGEGPDRR